MIELLVYRDNREVDRYLLGTGATTLGRAEDCDLLLDDSAVSRNHARLRVEGGRVFLADLGSGNGTWFQGLRVREMELEDGAEFRIEPFSLRIAISRTHANVAAATRPVDVSRVDGPTSQSGPFVNEPAALFEDSASAPKAPGGSAALGPRLERVRSNEPPFLLTKVDLTIGRGDDASITLRDAAISRRHATLTFYDGRFTLQDLDSANGTWVNGERLHGSRVLTDGDKLRFGDTDLLFVDPAAATISKVDLVPTKPVVLDDTEPPREVPLVEAARAARRAERPQTPRPRRMPEEDESELPIPISEPSRSLALVEHTEAGPPPPSAFEEIPETWIPPSNFEDTGAGGPAMELSEIGPAPRDEQRRRLLLIGAAIGLVAFLAIVMMRPSANPANGPEPEPDKVQRTMLLTMDRMNRDAEEALASEPKNFAKAIDNYSRMASFGRREELVPFAHARELARLAAQNVEVLHQALLVKALREETARRAVADEGTRKKIAAGLAAAADGIAAGRRGSLDGYDRALRALAEVLALHPGDADATRLLAESRPEREALAVKQNAARKDQIDRDCKAIHARASAKQAGGSAAGLREAVGLFDQIIQDTDPSGVTSWKARAETDRARALASLGRLAAPLRDSARRSLAASDPRAARKFLRSAVSVNPFDAQIRDELAGAQAECLRSATHHLQLAKAYNEARNFHEALAECELTQSFADRPEDKLWQQAEVLKKDIRRAGER